VHEGAVALSERYARGVALAVRDGETGSVVAVQVAVATK